MQNSCKPRKKSLLQRWSGEKELWFWSLLFISYWVIFFVIPVYGITYAFFDYTPGRQLTWDRFVGLKHFQAFFKTRDTVKIIRNTLVLSGLKSGTSAQVFSTDGRMVQTLTANYNGTFRLSLSSLPTGVYVVKVNDTTYKILKQ